MNRSRSLQLQSSRLPETFVLMAFIAVALAVISTADLVLPREPNFLVMQSKTGLDAETLIRVVLLKSLVVSEFTRLPVYLLAILSSRSFWLAAVCAPIYTFLIAARLSNEMQMELPIVFLCAFIASTLSTRRVDRSWNVLALLFSIAWPVLRIGYEIAFSGWWVASWIASGLSSIGVGVYLYALLQFRYKLWHLATFLVALVLSMLMIVVSDYAPAHLNSAWSPTAGIFVNPPLFVVLQFVLMIGLVTLSVACSHCRPTVDIETNPS